MGRRALDMSIDSFKAEGMPVENGGGTNARLDRIESILERVTAWNDRLAERQDEFQAEIDKLLRAQIIQQDRIEKGESARLIASREIDERIAKMVSAMGELIAWDGHPRRGNIEDEH